jgi:glycerol-3-phosphate dehydrogenase
VGDGRMCFAIPKEHITYVGTTDTIYNSDIEDIKIEDKDINYLIAAINKAFAIKKISREDIISAWAGLRPLILKKNKKTSELSRKDEMIISDSGLITIAGGKLTGYRLMAKKVVDKVCNLENINKKCKTRQLKLVGSNFIKKHTLDDYYNIIKQKLEKCKLDQNKSNYLVNTYGNQCEEIIKIFIENNFEHIVEAEAIFCLKYENTHTLLDFFLRRTRKIYYNPKAVKNELKIVSNIFKDKLNINNETLLSQEREVNKNLKLI